MFKGKKIVKLSEELMSEILNAERGFISGSFVEYPGNSQVRTSTNKNKKYGRAWHTDDQAFATAQRGKYYQYLRGYGSYGGGIRETYNIVDDISEQDIYQRNSDNEVVSKRNNSEIFGNGEIPDIEELYQEPYNFPDLADNVKDLVSQIKNLSSGLEPELSSDLLAISLQAILKNVALQDLTQEQRQKLKSYF